jgi:CDP-4-dehydro-6-deoxyglucose reductase
MRCPRHDFLFAMTHRVTLHPSASGFDCAPGQAILKAGLAAGLRLPFSCRSGMCRTCKGRVVSGQVDFGDAHVKYLSEAERAQGHALLCCATPLSDLVIEAREVRKAGDIQIRTLPCRVQKIERPTDDVVILYLKLPTNERLQFLAGQYLDILLKDGTRRSFSMWRAATCSSSSASLSASKARASFSTDTGSSLNSRRIAVFFAISS